MKPIGTIKSETFSGAPSFSRLNNIEWLRLVFAIQVMVVHTFYHIDGVEIPFITYFPGVPAFFFTSGFLIYASYLKSKSVKAYFINRYLRLFPALFVVCLAALILVVSVKGIPHLQEHLAQYLIWFVGQITIGQAYNPSMFRDIGVGVLNGSLWTITVEILFYFSVPVIVFLERSYKHIIVTLFVCSFVLYAIGPQFLNGTLMLGKSTFDFLKLTPLVWGWMFLSGSLCYKYFDVLKPYIPKFGWVVVPIILMILLDRGGVFLNTKGNVLGLLYFILYISLIMYVAFAVRYVPLGFDLSYGVYIWHMIVVNAFLVYGIHSIINAIIVTFLLSAFSWYRIEKPSLKKKKYSLQNMNKVTVDYTGQNMMRS